MLFITKMKQGAPTAGGAAGQQRGRLHRHRQRPRRAHGFYMRFHFQYLYPGMFPEIQMGEGLAKISNFDLNFHPKI